MDKRGLKILAQVHSIGNKITSILMEPYRKKVSSFLKRLKKDSTK